MTQARPILVFAALSFSAASAEEDVDFLEMGLKAHKSLQVHEAASMKPGPLLEPPGASGLVQSRVGLSLRRLLAIALLFTAPSVAATELAPEAEVKAGFVLSIARYTRWPLSGLEGRNIPLCLFGQGTLDSATDFLEGRLVRGRTITVSEIQTVEEIANCAILFIGDEQDAALDQVCAAAEENSTLTIADSSGFADRCVMINLVRTDRRVTFEVNQRAAMRARLRLSSELLKLGRLIGPASVVEPELESDGEPAAAETDAVVPVSGESDG
jgi:YfiR/HmsC-like